MTDEEEFVTWVSPLRNKMLKKTDTFYWSEQAWLEKGKRDREKVTEAVNGILHCVPWSVGQRLRELLEEMK